MKPCNIFQIQRLSVNDGEGIRTTVFFKGCALRCQWCANPESWSFESQLMFLPHKCCGCGSCLAVCQQSANTRDDKGNIVFFSEKCIACGACINNCVQNARQQMGKELPVAAVIAEIKKDYIFYQESGGGVTFSGGEPFLHLEYLRQLNQACHSIGINTAVESCAHFDFESCQDIVANIDQLFFDIKIMDSAKHKKYTGQDNAMILANIAAASRINSNIIVRVPVIAGVNEDGENMLAVCSFLKEKTAIRKVELLPYHKLGFEKMAALGIPTIEFASPDEDRMEHLNELIMQQGLEVVSFK